MHPLLSTALKASSSMRAIHLITRLRTSQAQQQSIQRRAYASTPGSQGNVQSRNIPWMLAAAAGMVGGLYLVVKQDTSQGSADRDGDHAKARKTGAESQNGNSNKKTGEKNIEKKLEPSQPGAGRPDPREEGHMVGHSLEDPPKASEPGKTTPDKSDKPDPRGKPKSMNETSGKQEGMSNADTHHSSQVSKQADKSKKGEGVAETAKLKGTVSTNRPGAENKEERGKAQMDKDA